MLRKARVDDVKTIHRMINSSSGKGEMLPRSLMDIYSSVRDFFVFYDETESRITGICAMNIIWENLAEIRSLYVDEDYRNRGVGRNLVEACISEAITLGLFKVFTLTYKKGFLKNWGLKELIRIYCPKKYGRIVFVVPNTLIIAMKWQ